MRLSWLWLILVCAACGQSSDPLRIPKVNAISCGAEVVGDSAGADTVYRWMTRDAHDPEWGHPQVVEAVYDSAGELRQLASITEAKLGDGSLATEVLWARLEPNADVRASRVRFSSIETPALDHHAARMHERFSGPAYIPRIARLKPGEQRPDTLSADEIEKVRALGAFFSKLRCASTA